MTPMTTADAVGRHLDDCWNRIGVRGDRSCPQLPQHIHCRNCPVYGNAAAGMLDGELPAQYREQWTRHFAQPNSTVSVETRSALIFRVGPEWLALPTAVVAEIAEQRPIHSLPHRSGSHVLGLTNVRGELLICLSLDGFLGLDAAVPHRHGIRHRVYPRLLVVHGDGGRLVFPVDEVHGTLRFPPSELRPLPATVAKAGTKYTSAILPWTEHMVGCLDDQLLLYALNRSLA